MLMSYSLPRPSSGRRGTKLELTLRHPPTTRFCPSPDRQQRQGEAFSYYQMTVTWKWDHPACMIWEHLNARVNWWIMIIFVTFLCIYRPSHSDKNQFTCSQFIDEFDYFLNINISLSFHVILRNFNFNYDNPQEK